jgi:hypothetical protein
MYWFCKASAGFEVGGHTHPLERRLGRDVNPPQLAASFISGALRDPAPRLALPVAFNPGNTFLPGVSVLPMGPFLRIPFRQKQRNTLILLHLSLKFGGYAQSNGQTFVPGSVPRLRGNWHGRRDDFMWVPHDRDWRLRHLVGMRG